MKKLVIFAVILLAISTACEKKEIQVDNSKLTNRQAMNQLSITDAGIWNTLASQSISAEDQGQKEGAKKVIAFQEFPKGDNYYFALYEDLYPSEGDYDFNDVMLKSKLYLLKWANFHEGYIETSLFNKGGSLPAEIGLMFYSVSGNSYERIPYENIRVNGEQLTDGPWTTPLSELDNEWSIDFEFDYKASNIWISYFINVQGEEIMTGGFAPSSVESFTTPYPTYLTKNNLPWGLEIETDEFAIPNEKELFLNCYPEFQEWAESGGVKNKKWYESPDPAYTHN